MGCMAGVRPPAESNSLLHSIQIGSGATQLPVQWVLGALSKGVKWLEHETDHSLQHSTKVKNGGAIPPAPTDLHGVVLN
jgi:hypothetical protein